MERLRRYVQSASRLYSLELSIFFLVCYSVLFGISLVLFLRSAMNHSFLGMFEAGVFVLMGLAFAFIEAQVVRAIATNPDRP